MLCMTGVDRDSPRLNRPVGHHRADMSLDIPSYVQHFIADVASI